MTRDGGAATRRRGQLGAAALALASLVLSPAPADARRGRARDAAQEAPGYTCDPGELSPTSWDLVTRGQSLAVTGPRYRRLERLEAGEHERALDDIDLETAAAAERALELDPRNLAARALLARQYVVLEQPEAAAQAWREVLGAGFSVVWPASLPGVDPGSFFVVAFDRDGMRIWRLGQLDRFQRIPYTEVPRFPESEDRRFWARIAGCIDPAPPPAARVAWSDLERVEVVGGALRLWLARPVVVTSDRGRSKRTDRLAVALHARLGGHVEEPPPDEPERGVRLRDSFSFVEVARSVLLATIDPEGRVEAPPVRRSPGW